MTFAPLPDMKQMHSCRSQDPFPPFEDTSERRFYFYHIPKTAGTSVRYFLEQFFRDGTVCPALQKEDFLKIEAVRLHSFRMFSGHLYEEPLKLFGRSLDVFCLIRDPIAHFASFIAYWIKLRVLPPNASDEEIIALARKQFVSLIEHSSFDLLQFNYQTRFLAGLADYESRPILTRDRDRALDKLAGFHSIGTVERLQESLDLLCYKMRWPHSQMSLRLNTTPSSQLIIPEDMPRLARIQQFDFDLYGFADGRLSTEMTRVFGRDLSAENRKKIIDFHALYG